MFSRPQCLVDESLCEERSLHFQVSRCLSNPTSLHQLRSHPVSLVKIKVKPRMLKQNAEVSSHFLFSLTENTSNQLSHVGLLFYQVHFSVLSLCLSQNTLYHIKKKKKTSIPDTDTDKDKWFFLHIHGISSVTFTMRKIVGGLFAGTSQMPKVKIYMFQILSFYSRMHSTVPIHCPLNKGSRSPQPGQ